MRKNKGLQFRDDFETFGADKLVKEHARKLADFGEKDFWIKNYKKYYWEDKDSICKLGDDNNWRDGLRIRFDFNEKLRAKLPNVKTVNEIVNCWGKLKKFDDSRSKELLSIIKPLENNQAKVVIDNDKLLEIGRISAVSKILAMYDPEKWTIYDSRVAHALHKILKPNKGNELFYFPVPAGRKERKGQNEPGPSSAKQHLIAFLNASWLLRVAAEIMNEDKKYGRPEQIDSRQGSNEWQVYHLEMALFMYGKS